MPYIFFLFKIDIKAGCQWFTPVILAIWETEIRRSTVQTQPGQMMRPYLEKNPSQKRAGRVVQGEGPEFKPQSHNNNKRKRMP
jgi:hypothetical protein